jgi:threonine dehydrogenase-like Zn-dependent dehydrogenase
MSQMVESRVVELLGPRQLTFTPQALDLGTLDAQSVAARTLYSAISPGTELAAWRGDPPLRPGPVYPRLVGYCNVAEVMAVGAEVQTLKPGDRILTGQAHRTAFICKQSTVIGRVPDALGSIEATTTYLFHLGYAGLLNGDFRPGHAVAVLGLGTIGMGCVLLADRLGGRVIALSNHPASLQQAQSLGIRRTWRKDTPDLARRLAEATDSGIDLVVSTSNAWDDWWLALGLPRKLGVISVIGFPGRGQPPPSFNPLDSRYFYDNQLRLVAGGYAPDVTAAPHDMRFTRPRNCAYLMELLTSKRLPARALIGSVEPAHRIEACYEALCEDRTSAGTVVLDWTQA